MFRLDRSDRDPVPPAPTPAAPARPQSTRLAILIPFGIVTLLWGATWIVIADQLAVVPASWSVTYRFVAAGLTMLVWALIRGERFDFDARGWGFAIALAISQFCINYNFVYRAEEHITSGLVAVLFALLIVPNAILGRAFLGQRLGRQLLAGSGIAIAGVALLFVHEARIDPSGFNEALIGIGCTMVALLGASIANILQATQTARAYPMVAMLAVAMLIGAAIDGALAWTTAGPPVVELRIGYIAGILYLGVLATAFAFKLYFGIIRVIGPVKAAYSSVLIPVIAMLFSTAFEGYRWTPLALGGGLLTLIGLVVALRARRPAR
ncbi:drug/metabolite transporter (DMT)-like permease [Hephaestia caeni]|uniref:Drug/metabolite transporter (DMT)-like permease n=1 Tax=Hephaestia caeni TaxID=645617 RepID=A0A397P9Y8_9SPHN|nr:drug/metabolite transporter (DMT)-like permease [Hephaestia caeni]